MYLQPEQKFDGLFSAQSGYPHFGYRNVMEVRKRLSRNPETSADPCPTTVGIAGPVGVHMRSIHGSG